jgi:hypothetical protein
LISTVRVSITHTGVFRPRALENPVDIAGRAAQLIVDIDTIGH